MNRNTVAKVLSTTAGVGVAHITTTIINNNVATTGTVEKVVVTTGKFCFGLCAAYFVKNFTEKFVLEAAAALQL